MRKSFIVILSIIFIVFSFFQACSLYEELVGTEDEEDDGEISIETEKKGGNLKPDDGANVNVNDFQVITMTDLGEINQNGSFEVEGNISENYQILVIKKPSQELPVYIGLYDPVKNIVKANDTTTAMCLTLLNPYLVYTTQTQRVEYLEAVKKYEDFGDLVDLLKAAYASDPDNALNYEENPKIYQLTVEIMKGVMEYLGGINDNNDQDLEPPTVQDLTGTKINFNNPRRIHYTAGISSNGGNISDLVAIDKSSPITYFNWGWPPEFSSTVTQTEYDLGDGDFEINITKGIDYSVVSEWDDIVGRSTKMNSAQAILYFMNLFTGFDIEVDAEELDLSVSSELSQNLKSSINEKNTEEFIYHFCDLMYNNSSNISKWLLGIEHEAAEQFIKSYTRVLKNAVFVFKLMGFVNQDGPFYWELVNSPTRVIYNITQTNGSITEQEENNPPEAEFIISPPAGIIGTDFTFDAASTTDDIDGQANLEYRWDFNSDGSWEQNWSSSTATNHTYSVAGSYLVTLEVRDSAGLIGTITHRVNVGGGAGTATHVKLFQDGRPWNSDAMITMLTALGFTEGTGANQYEVIPSSEMATVPLIPGTDLVIIANDQDNYFYQNYADNQVRFNNFVYMGGSLFWEACDKGWANGSMQASGVVLPGNIVTNYDYDYYNYVTDQNLPLVSNLPDTLDHNYASHESFTNLPDGTTIYCVDSYQRPTLIEYNLGGGWIIVTGQPLEHQYDNLYGKNDMEELLPRIVSYFTGKEFSKTLAKPIRKRAGRPSSSR